jgi:hypothetical protein
MPECAPSRLYVGDRIVDIVPLLMDGLRANGASVSGSASSGQLSISTPVGSIRGAWTIDGKSLAIEIPQRPAAVSCGQIESKLQDAILDAKNVLRQREKAK